jgi:hypothetical protein
MVVVFAAFTLSTDRTIKMIGLGMATAILVDALIVRTVLVPALMQSKSPSRSDEHKLALKRLTAPCALTVKVRACAPASNPLVGASHKPGSHCPGPGP